MTMLLFYFSCAIIFVVCGYLTVASCYRTGVLGSVGFGFAACGAGVIVFEALAGTQYDVAYETRFIVGGIALYLIQTAWRARHHGVKALKRRREDQVAA
jgi:hypothetical protein